MSARATPRVSADASPRVSARASPALSAWAALSWSCRRDLLLAARGKADLALVLIFFVLVTSLFPLGVGPEAGMLRAIAPGIIWVCALLAALMSFTRLFASDYADGTLEQMLVSGAPLPALVAGKIVAHALPNPTQTVLDYLRLEEKSKGTKEGCNEGDCGACTVVLGELREGKLVYAPVNACILLVAQLHGKELVTVDDIAENGVLHPVQQAMVDMHASQCGFCTPGMIMTAADLLQHNRKPTEKEIRVALEGNFCRCTGKQNDHAGNGTQHQGPPDNQRAISSGLIGQRE